MSTKITKAAGGDWHLYLDVNDEDYVWLGVGQPYGFAVRIPLRIWNEIVRVGPIEKGSWG